MTMDCISNCPDIRQEFFFALKQLSSQFAAAKEDVTVREEAFKRALYRLTVSLREPVGDIASKRFAQGNGLVKAAHEADKKVAARLELWQNRVELYDRNTEFRKDFGDSLLVYVYGKVKAGKSTLGNYVAYGDGDPNEQLIAQAEALGLKPEFSLRDTTNSLEIHNAQDELQKQNKFAVGAQETTNGIQCFRLPGLTWVDSPGLHSVTQENGDLARSYADSADLILFPMNSGQPGRASDLNEIASLLRARKAFIVVITRCDTVEIDEDDEGNLVSTLLMKIPKDRQDQVNYVRQEILAKADQEAQDLLDAEIITVSVKYAQEHGDDPTLLRESGMSLLFEKLTTLTHDQGVALKTEAPLNNLRAFVDLVLDGDTSIKKKEGNLATFDGDISLRGLRTDLKSLEESIFQQRSGLERMQLEVTGRVLLELDPAIALEVIKQRTSRDITALSRACSKIVQDIVALHISEKLIEVLRDTDASINKAVRFDEFKDIPEFRELTKDVTLSNEGKGRAIGGGAGAVIGGVVGLLGGPWGSAAGAYIGNWLGAKAGCALAGETTITVSLGDNTHDVIAETTRIASNAAQASIITAFKQLEQDFLAPVEARACEAIAALNHFEATLIKEVRP
jgi:predicted GTPase